MSPIPSESLAILAGLEKRTIQRKLAAGLVPGAVRSEGGHWIVPDNEEVRAWCAVVKRKPTGGGRVDHDNHIPHLMKLLTTLRAALPSMSGNGRLKLKRLVSPLFDLLRPLNILEQPPQSMTDELEAMSIARFVVGILVVDRRPKIGIDCFALVVHTGNNMDGITEIAKRHGVTRSAISRRCVDLCDTYGIVPTGAMRSLKTRCRCQIAAARRKRTASAARKRNNDRGQCDYVSHLAQLIAVMRKTMPMMNTFQLHALNYDVGRLRPLMDQAGIDWPQG